MGRREVPVTGEAGGAANVPKHCAIEYRHIYWQKGFIY